ncbi:hypothetical protein AAEH79_19390 [Shewanella xiamenensis]
MHKSQPNCCKNNPETSTRPNMRDLSDAEIDAFEDGLSRSDYGYLLNTDQIEDVIANLKQQKAQPSEQELLEAIIFYYERDAFIDI